MITISAEFAQEIKELLEKLKSSDDNTDKLRLDIISGIDFLVRDEDYPDHHDAQEN